MSELLIKTNKTSYDVDDVVSIRPDGWGWGTREEFNPSKFRIEKNVQITKADEELLLMTDIVLNNMSAIGKIPIFSHYLFKKNNTVPVASGRRRKYKFINGQVVRK